MGLLTGLLAIAGCVRPGGIDTGELARYQQAMARRTDRRTPEDAADWLRPRPSFALPALSTAPVVERVTEITRTYTPPGDANTEEYEDHIHTVHVVTDFDLDPNTGRAREETGRLARRVERQTTRRFRRMTDPTRAIRKVFHRLAGTVCRQAEFVPAAETGQPVKRSETVTTSTYEPPAGPTTAPAPTDADGQAEVRVRTTVQVTRYLRTPAGSSEPVQDPQTEETTTLPMWRYEQMSGRPGQGAANTARTVERRRVGRFCGAPAVLDSSRRVVRLGLMQAVQAALAANPDIRVVSFDPEVSQQEMIAAAAAFDTAVFFEMGFVKEEGGNPAMALIEDVRRIRGWEAGLRRQTITGATWTLQNELSRNWDTSAMDGLYKSVVALEVTQPLLRNAWPAFNLAALRIARVTRGVTDAQFRATVEEIVTAVATAYWQLVAARRMVTIQQDLVELARRTLGQIRARLRVDATRASVEQARATLRRRQTDLIDARQAVGDAQDQLAHLAPVGALRFLKDAEIVPTTEPLTEGLHVDPAEQLLTALRHSPLLEQARLGIAAAKINIAVAENQTLPVVDLSAAVELQRFNPSVSGHWDVTATPGHWAMGYELGLLVDYPIGNRLARARLRQAWLAHTQSIAAMQKTVNDLALSISQQVRALQRSHEKIIALRAAAAAAEAELQAVRLSELSEARVSPQVLRTRLRAQEGLARVRRDLAEAVAEYNSGRAELNKTTGTGLEVQGVRVALPTPLGGRPARPPR